MPTALFDLDDTLVDRQAAFNTWALYASSEHGVPLPWLHAADTRFSGNRMEFFRQMCATYPVQHTPKELHTRFRRESPTYIPMRRTVWGLLTLLSRAGWRMAVVTNGDTEAQWAKLRHAGLDSLFNVVVVSKEAGVAKPDPRIFRMALESCGHTPGEQAWMMGDNHPNDIIGGKHAGVHTCLVGNGYRPDLDAPDMRFPGVEEAIHTLIQLT